MSSLQNDCIFEILTWLPGKELYKFMAVSKVIRSILTDRFFHVRQSQHIKANSAILLQGYDSVELIFFDAISGIPDDSVDFLRRKCKRIVASSKGLLIFQSKDWSPYLGNLCVYNPVRQAFQLISPPKRMHFHTDHKIGVCVTFEVDSPDYWLICVMPTQTSKEVWASQYDCIRYSSRNMSWEYVGIIEAGSRSIDLENPIMANGFMYWASDTGSYMKGVDPYIFMFDVEKRSSEVLPLPPEARELNYDDYDIKVASWEGDSLCLLQYRRSAKKMLILWATEEKRPSQDSWMKVHEVSLESIGLGDWDVENFSVINCELLVFCMRDKLCSYNMREGRINRLTKHKQGCYHHMQTPYVHADSLRWSRMRIKLLLKLFL